MNHTAPRIRGSRACLLPRPRRAQGLPDRDVPGWYPLVAMMLHCSAAHWDPAARPSLGELPPSQDSNKLPQGNGWTSKDVVGEQGRVKRDVLMAVVIRHGLRFIRAWAPLTRGGLRPEPAQREQRLERDVLLPRPRAGAAASPACMRHGPCSGGSPHPAVAESGCSGSRQPQPTALRMPPVWSAPRRGSPARAQLAHASIRL